MNSGVRLERVNAQSDFDCFARMAFNEPVMVMNMGRVFTQEEAEGYFASMLSYASDNPSSGGYKAFDVQTGAFIGMGSLWLRDDGAEIDYMVLPEYWGKGYAAAIAARLVDIARAGGVQRVTGITDPGNAASARVLIKNGFAFDHMMHVDEDDSDAAVYVLKL